MSSDSFTKENLDTYLKELAKEYRRLNGKSPCKTPKSPIKSGFSGTISFLLSLDGGDREI